MLLERNTHFCKSQFEIFKHFIECSMVGDYKIRNQILIHF